MGTIKVPSSTKIAPTVPKIALPILAATLLTKARPLVSGVILTAPGDDPAALTPLIDAIG